MINRRKSISLYLAAAILFFSACQQTIVQAIDVDYYSGNDILYYDPTSCSVTNKTGDIAIVGNDNAEKIFKFLISTKFSGLGDKPFNALQAAGALGNFHQESRMDPTVVEPVNPPYVGQGHGIAQWSYATEYGQVTGPGRLGILLDLAKSEGKEWSDLSLQLLMLQNEINGTYGAILLAQGFDSVSTPAESSYIFQSVYEGAGEPNQAIRDDAAQSFFAKYKDLAPGDVSIGGSSPTSCGTGSVSGGLTNFSGSDFKIFNQCNYPPYGDTWGDMAFNGGVTTGCLGGCGPTALAMVVANMTGQNVTPLDTMNYYDSANLWFGIGSNQDGLEKGADHYGLSASAFDTKDINAYKAIFDKGGIVIVAGQGAAPFLVDNPHYVVIRAITEDGKFLIGDPGQGTSTNGTPEDPVTWDPTSVMMMTIPEFSRSFSK